MDSSKAVLEGLRPVNNFGIVQFPAALQTKQDNERRWPASRCLFHWRLKSTGLQGFFW